MGWIWWKTILSPLKMWLPLVKTSCLSSSTGGWTTKHPLTSWRACEREKAQTGVVEEMHKKNVPQWFIDSCLKIKYLFPKPHAAAYAQTSYRIAYFKVYYPLQFYATYFSIKASDFDGDLAVLGADAIKKRFLDVKSAGKTATAKDQDMQPHLETAYEMYCRGYRFYPWILSFPMPPTMSLKMTASGFPSADCRVWAQWRQNLFIKPGWRLLLRRWTTCARGLKCQRASLRR